MATAATKLMTAEEFFDFCHRPENRDRFFELERGEVVEKPQPGERHGVVCANVVWVLGTFARQRRKGIVCSNDTGVILEREPDTVNGPDVFFHDENRRYEELNLRYDERPPQLVVEVLSPWARQTRVVRRVNRFLRKGVLLVWVLDPEDRSVTVYRAGREAIVLDEGSEITGEDVLPDLRCRIAEFFALPGQ